MAGMYLTDLILIVIVYYSEKEMCVCFYRT
jgi:hypothetical protein